MTSINPIIQARLPRLNYQISDYIPIVSTITNLGLLALKGISSLHTSPLSYSHNWLNGASQLNVLRSFLLLVPILGNIAIYLYDKRELDTKAPLEYKLDLAEIQQSSHSGLNQLYHYSSLSLCGPSTFSSYGWWESDKLRKERHQLLILDLFQLLHKEPDNSEALGAILVAAKPIEDLDQFLPLLKQANYDSWEALATKAAALNPTDAAVQASASEHLADPLTYSVKAVEQNPTNFLYWKHLRLVLLKTGLKEVEVNGKTIGARECLIKQIESNPKKALDWAALGDCFGDRFPSAAISGELITREMAYIRALDLDPNHPDAEESWVHLGNSLRWHPDSSYPLKVGGREIHHAYECYIQAIEINPTYKEAWERLMHHTQKNKNLSLLINGKRFHSSTELAIRGLELHPNSSWMWNFLGSTLQDFPQTVLVNQQTVTNAYECYIKALELAPHDDLIWKNLGEAFPQPPQTVRICEQKITTARECFAKALSLDPTNVNYERLLRKASSKAQNLYRHMSDLIPSLGISGWMRKFTR